MRLTELRSLVDERPFEPFRIVLSDGSEHLVSDPKHVFLFKHTVMLCVLEQPDDEFPAMKHLFDPLHVTRVEKVSAT